MGESSKRLVRYASGWFGGRHLGGLGYWKTRNSDSHIGDHLLSLRCRCIATNDLWTFTVVYGPVVQGFKDSLWAKLDTVGRCWSSPWLVAGDFNAIKQNSERSSGRALRYERVMSREFIDTFKIDRYIANLLWLEMC